MDYVMTLTSTVDTPSSSAAGDAESSSCPLHLRVTYGVCGCGWMTGRQHRQQATLSPAVGCVVITSLHLQVSAPRRVTGISSIKDHVIQDG
jgi:hypothetical protein